MGVWHMFVLEVPFGAGGVNPPIVEKCEGGVAISVLKRVIAGVN